MTAPRRRWFRFTLRTLFVVVTLAAIAASWVAYQINWIRARHTFLEIAAAEPRSMQTNIAMALDARLGRPDLSPPAPWSLRIFREPAVALIVVRDEFTASEWVEKARGLFPEARVCFLFGRGIQLQTQR
jgi:hypothetical protein